MAVHAGQQEDSRVCAELADREMGGEFEPVTMVEIAALLEADSPRISGENLEHARLLAVTDAELPPIIVHRDTMRVIDGVHRLLAARIQGAEKIAVRFFSGCPADAFVVAVRSNITHGLPLSLADREAAAARITSTHPQWSDRMIASVTGLAPNTVAETRKRLGIGTGHAAARIGKDGRVRPVDRTAGRMHAAELIADNPDISLRQLGHAAGISPETARDVRNRIRRGENPVPGRRATGRVKKPAAPRGDVPQACDDPPAARMPGKNRVGAIERLRGDPALRFTETGRTLLRMLSVHGIEDEQWEKIAENVPLHCSGTIAAMARACADMWGELADQMARKAADIT
jgi:hypothetical protein